MGWTEGEKKKKKPLERKTHFLRQKKKIKSGFIKVNFTGERRERAKHNVLEISSARLRPRKQDKAASAVSAGVHWGELGPGVWLQAIEVGADLLENLVHGALGVELGTERVSWGTRSSESNWNSSKDAFWPSLEGVMLGMRGVKPTPNQAELSLPAFLIIPSHHFPSPGTQAPSCGAGGY